MQFMIIEHFKNRDAMPVYRRFRDAGRLMPQGLVYVASWVAADFSRCFQIMECNDPKLLEQWTANWNDLVDFEIVPVVTSAEARAAIEPLL